MSNPARKTKSVSAHKSRQPTLADRRRWIDHTFPDGRGVINFIGFHFLGPWLAPSLNKKGYNENEGRPIVARLIDRHNDMLASLPTEFPFFHPVDLRGTLPKKSDWVNELHPTNAGFKRVAKKIREKLKSIGI